MSWCPLPPGRCTLEPVCDRFTIPSYKPPGAPSQPRTGMSQLQFRARLLAGDHCILVLDLACFFHGFTVTFELLFPDA